MANKNFVVHNGLTVGGVTIFAGNGDIRTAGNITVTGSGIINVPSIGVSSISTNDSSIGINDTGSGSTIEFVLDGATAANISASVVNVPGLTSTGTVRITNNSDTINSSSGALQVTGGVGIGANLYVNGWSTLRGNVNIGGNLTVTGTSVSIGTSDLAIQDPIINLHTFANLEPLTSVTTEDIGIKFHYYDSVDSAAFLGRAADTGYLEWYAKGTDTANVFTGTYYGTIKGGAIWLANTTPSTSITTGALRVDGGAGFNGNIYTSGWIIPSANTTQNLGTTNSWWGTYYGVSTQAKYADLAENYQADAIYEPGTVLMFGGENEVTLAGPDTTAVAGIVSTNPAHLMNGALQGARVVALALQGRVPCKVIGPVAKGDILISAGFGFAKAATYSQLGMKFGQAIGKALENVEPGTKTTIEVVVGRV